MSQKQFMVRKPKVVRKPIRPVRVDADEKQEYGSKHGSVQASPALIQRASQSPQSIPPAEAAQLQRTVGNQALGRLTRIQAKMTVGPVGDKYEQEADAVAKQVVNRLSDGDQSDVQRQEDEEELQMKPIAHLQRQEDEEELQMKPLTHLQRQEDEEELQMKPIPHLQRQEEDEEVQMKSSSTMEGGDLSAGIEGQIQSAKGGGRPLPPNTQSSMGQAFNADFSGVKVHTDGQSDHLNQSIQARAFTTGQDIFFRQGEYNPDSSGGQELLAHELTHTIQQTGGQAQRRSVDRPVVQRLIMSRDFMTNAGITQRKKKGEMSDLLHALDKYNVQKAFLSLHPSETHYETILQLLGIVENKAKAWENTTGSSKGVGRFFRKGAKARHTKKKTAVSTLLTEITTERTMLTIQKENLLMQETQQPMIDALEEGEARPDMVTSYLEMSMEETDPETLVKKLELSQKVIDSQIQDMLSRQKRGETVSEEEVIGAGRSLQGLNVVGGQLFSITRAVAENDTITGKFEESIKGALNAQVKGSDPKQLYEYSQLDRNTGMGLEAKGIRAAINTAVRKYLDRTQRTETKVGQYIGNTNEGKMIREAFMWLGNPVIKWLYDLYISDPTEFAKMDGLIEPARSDRLMNIVMQTPMLSMKAQDLPGAEKAFQLSGATFYALPTGEEI